MFLKSNLHMTAVSVRRFRFKHLKRSVKCAVSGDIGFDLNGFPAELPADFQSFSFELFNHSLKLHFISI